MPCSETSVPTRGDKQTYPQCICQSPGLQAAYQQHQCLRQQRRKHGLQQHISQRPYKDSPIFSSAFKQLKLDIHLWHYVLCHGRFRYGPRFWPTSACPIPYLLRLIMMCSPLTLSFTLSSLLLLHPPHWAWTWLCIHEEAGYLRFTRPTTFESPRGREMTWMAGLMNKPLSPIAKAFSHKEVYGSNGIGRVWEFEIFSGGPEGSEGCLPPNG